MSQEQGAVVARLAGVTHRYGATRALDGVTLDIPAGRMVGFASLRAAEDAKASAVAKKALNRWVRSRAVECSVRKGAAAIASSDWPTPDRKLAP